MPGIIIKIRLLQFYRLIRGIGVFRMVFLLLIAGFVVFVACNLLTKPGYTPAIAAVMSVIILSIHISRRDRNFLLMVHRRPYFIYLTEYFLIMLPFMVIAFVVSNFKAAGLLLAPCFLVPFIHVKADFQAGLSLLKILVNPFNLQHNLAGSMRLPLKNPLAFEWISGLRSNFIVLIPVYLVVLAFSFRAIVAPVGMLIISGIISGFYYYGEPREFIEIFASGPSAFIARKMIVSIKYLSCLLSPIVLLSLVFQPGTWYWIIGAWVVSCIFQVVTIIFKYALFRENSDLSSNGLIVLFNIMCILLPFFWPVPIIMGSRYYLKAKQNLKPYFDDHNT